MSLLIMLIIGYLLGSISFSIIFTRIFVKKDVRDYGSGNAGFTNTLRTAGKSTAILVFICDAAKAVVAILIAMVLEKFTNIDSLLPYCKYFAAIGVVLGHNFPLYYGFRGGKGIVVSIAIIFSMNWITGCVVFAAFLIAFLSTGYVSLGSVIGAITTFVSTLVMFLFGLHNVGIAELILMTIMSALAVYMHRTNIKKLINGTESSFKKKK